MGRCARSHSRPWEGRSGLLLSLLFLPGEEWACLYRCDLVSPTRLFWIPLWLRGRGCLITAPRASTLTSQLVQGGSLESSPGFPAGEGRMPITTVGRGSGRPGSHVASRPCFPFSLLLRGEQSPISLLGLWTLPWAGCVCVLCLVDAKGQGSPLVACVAGFGAFPVAGLGAAGVHSLLLTKC